ncbi:hypothetical protein HMPREF1982_03537 [Clostridiales bacterium oral taxon 876 str. F0540]|nr:hypothetical protein HMPREF1982_03537 [Clostridiales bacterium oral taxon 876 str. F0540]
MGKLFSKKQKKEISEQLQEISNDWKDIAKKWKEVKLISLQMKISNLLFIAKLEEDRKKLDDILEELHECIRKYNELLDEVYGLSS